MSKMIPNKSISYFVVFTLMLLTTGCTITHKHGEIPKVKIDNELADKTSVRIVRFEHGRSLMLDLMWYLQN